jgi:OmpA-OmpF porin, OOP family
LKLPYKVKLKYADELFRVGNYFQAMDVYLDLTNDKPENYYLTYQLAQCYMNARDYKQAEAKFRSVAEKASSDYPLAQYYYAMMLKMQGRYDEAKTAFGNFSSKSQSDENKKFADKAKREIEACDFAKNLVANPTTFQVTHIPANLNKSLTEFSPKVLNGELYYASLNMDSILNGQFYGKKLTLSHIYKADGTAGSWTQGKPIASPLNNDTEHTGNPSFSEDGKRVYFTKCEATGERNIKCKIYMSQFSNGKWGAAVELGAGINNADANNTHPAVSKGEADSDILYFSSNRKGGKGGYDIYFAEVKYSGTSGAAQNAGDVINTSDDEVTPFFSDKAGLLYFSSNGHLGLGGHDIFSAKGSKGAFEKPTNMGYPLNSSADDTYFTTGEDKKTYYLVSNRPGIIGEKSETCCDDIFRAYNNFVPKFAVAGNLTQKHEDRESPLNGVKVTLIDVTDGKEKIVKKDSLVNASNYFFNLEPEKKYNIKFQRKDHFPEYASVSTTGLEESDTFNINGVLNKIVRNKAYNLARIFYDYNSASLREESKVVLDTLYMMLVENPDMVIELSSHTDSIGSDSYNLKLSQGRAESCVNYLIAKGIPKERVIAKGYGESQPIAPNSSGKRDNPEGRQKNRRTEYKIIGELKNKDDKIIFK